MAELRTVLATREVPSLLATSMIGRLPTAMATLGILLLVRGERGDYTLAGALTALFTAGTAIGQPLLARIVDQRGQRRVLLGAAPMSAAAFVVLAMSGVRYPAISAVAAAVAGLGTPPLEPCLRALWPHVVVGGPALRTAFSLDVGLQEVIFVAGPLLAVAAGTVGGPRGGVLGCALFGLAGTAGFALTRSSRGWQPTTPAGDRHGSPLRNGVLVRVFVVVLASAVPVGALAIVAAVFAARHGNSSITGWVLAANAAGALAAGLYGAVRPGTRASARALALAGLAMAAGYLPLSLAPPVAAWLPLAAVAGLALPVVLSLAFQRIQLRCPPNLLTEANAWAVTAFGIGAAVAALLAGVVADHMARGTAIPVIVIACAAVTALGSLLSYRRD